MKGQYNQYYYTLNIQRTMKEASQKDEVKLEELDSEPDTPNFGTIEYIYDEYEELLSMAEMRMLSNVQLSKDEEATGKEEGNIDCQRYHFSFRSNNAPSLKMQNKEQLSNLSEQESEEKIEKTMEQVKLVKSMRLLNIEEKPEVGPEVAKETRQLEPQIDASDEVPQQSSMASTTLNGSRCGTIFNNTQDNIQDLPFLCLSYIENPKEQLNESITWKSLIFKTEEGEKRRRIKPLQYWNGESIKHMKANQSIIRYRKKIVETFVHAQDCWLIKGSKTQIMGSLVTKGEITVLAHVSVRLNFAAMVRVKVSKEHSLSICNNKLQIIAQRGKNSLVLKNRLLNELENTLDVDCTLHLKIYSEFP